MTFKLSIANQQYEIDHNIKVKKDVCVDNQQTLRYIVITKLVL